MSFGFFRMTRDAQGLEVDRSFEFHFKLRGGDRPVSDFSADSINARLKALRTRPGFMDAAKIFSEAHAWSMSTGEYGNIDFEGHDYDPHQPTPPAPPPASNLPAGQVAPPPPAPLPATPLHNRENKSHPSSIPLATPAPLPNSTNLSTIKTPKKLRK
jgi:hypothetical protein